MSTWKRNFAIAVAIYSGGTGSILTACEDDPVSTRPTGYDPTAPVTEGGLPPDASAQTVRIAKAEAAFRKLQTELVARCGGSGGTCHVDGTYPGNPTKFLAAPDPYKSVKAIPGIIVQDVYTSSLLTKGQHAGPAVSSDPDFETKVRDWLTLEALVLQGVDLPGTDPFSITIGGPNDIDISKAAKGVGPVRLKFDASLVGEILSLSKIKISAPAGQAVHIQNLTFYRIPAGAKPKDPPIEDPQQSFSTLDFTAPGGVDTTLPPGLVIFSGTGWTPFKSGDKLTLTVVKLEKGTIPEGGIGGGCKNPTLFNTTLGPIFNGQGNGAGINCRGAGCHGGSTGGGFDLRGLANAQDLETACRNVKQRINTANVPMSLVITKPAGAGGHSGGKVTNQGGFATDITNAQNGGLIF